MSNFPFMEFAYCTWIVPWCVWCWCRRDSLGSYQWIMNQLWIELSIRHRNWIIVSFVPNLVILKRNRHWMLICQFGRKRLKISSWGRTMRCCHLGLPLTWVTPNERKAVAFIVATIGVMSPSLLHKACRVSITHPNLPFNWLISSLMLIDISLVRPSSPETWFTF